MSFQWDERKAKANLKKHGVSFDEAKTVFDDPRVDFCADLEHSDAEDRFIALGMSMRERILVVCHCYRGDVVRIFSARKARLSEVERYHGAYYG